MKLTQLEFSKLIRCNVRTVGRWEKGDWLIPLVTSDLIGYIYREWIGKQTEYNNAFEKCWITSEAKHGILSE